MVVVFMLLLMMMKLGDFVVELNLSPGSGGC